MATPVRKITPSRLAEAKDEEEYWRRKSVAATLKSEALQLDPSLAEPSITRQNRSSSITDAYKTNYSEGLQIKAFREGLGEPSSNPKPVSPTTLITEKAAIIRSLASAGKSAQEIEIYLSKLGP